MSDHMPDQVDPLEKAETRTLSLPRGDWEYLTARGTATRSDRSKYVRQLLARDRDELASPSAPDAISPTILTGLCSRLRPELIEEFRTAVSNIGLPEPRLLAEILHLIIAYANDGGQFRGDFDPFIGSTQIPNISKACARGRARDSLADDRTPAVRAREEFCDLLRRLADHAGLDKPAPTKDLGSLLFDAEKLMKAARDLPMAVQQPAPTDGPPPIETVRILPSATIRPMRRIFGEHNQPSADVPLTSDIPLTSEEHQMTDHLVPPAANAVPARREKPAKR